MKKTNKVKTIVILIFSLFSLCSCSCNKRNSTNLGDRSIDFYYINDTHGAFKRQNTDTNYKEAGMAYISSYLKEKKYSDPNNSIILSGGDMFQGGFESNATHGEIIVDTMNEIGFDAMVLGNHEFDWGESTLISIADKLDCPIISCNTFYRETGERPEYIEPYTILEKNDFKIGVIGAAQKNMNSSITGSVSSAFSFPDPTQYVKEYSYQLRVEEKCDLVVAAFHDGGFEDNGLFKFGSLCQVDSRTNQNYVDGIFLAHDHRYKSGYTYGVPYLESGCNGRYVGHMNFQMNYTNNVYYVAGSSSDNVTAYITCKTEDPAIVTILDNYSDIIGAGSEVLYTFKNNYSKDEFAYIICEAIYWYTNDNKDYFGGHQIYFTSHNFGGVRVAVSKGEMTLDNLVSVCPFDNNIYIQKCTSENIEYMRNRSSSYATYSPSEIVYEDGYTYAASISYIVENETYGRYLQVEATEYQITAKQILIEYLRNNINPNL